MTELNFDIHFKDLFEHTSDLIHFLTIDGKIVIVNPSWLYTLGYSLEEVQGESIYNFIIPEHHNLYSTYRQNIITNGNNAELIETSFIHKNGNIIITEGQIGRVLIDHKTPFTRAVLRNITSRRNKEKQNEEIQKRLTSFFLHAPDAVIVINEQQKITDWNIKAETIFGFKASEVLGKLLGNLIIPEQYREAHNRGMAHFLRTGEGPVLNRTIEISALRKNGAIFPISLSISAIKVDEGWLFIAFIADITERKKMEESLIKKEAELLQAEIESQKKSEFLSIASHELKTPITTMKGYLQIINKIVEKQRTALPFKQYIVKANSQVVKLTDLVNDLLDVSKIQSGKIAYNFTEFKVREMIEDSIAFIAGLSPSHRVVVKGDLNHTIKADKVRLEQVLSNLLSNAVKYSPQANEIILSASIIDNWLTVSVTDFGIGISEQKIPHLFDMFFRGEDVSFQFSGLGLGLYISSEIIKRHKGRIWVESIHGEQSTFSFTIPQYLEPASL